MGLVGIVDRDMSVLTLILLGIRVVAWGRA